jgi:hypothetical protein
MVDDALIWIDWNVVIWYVGSEVMNRSKWVVLEVI